MSKYQVGEQARVIDNTCYHGFSVGDIVTITSVYENTDHEYYDAEVDNPVFGKNSWCVNNGDLEKL